MFGHSLIYCLLSAAADNVIAAVAAITAVAHTIMLPMSAGNHSNSSHKKQPYEITNGGNRQYW